MAEDTALKNHNKIEKNNKDSDTLGGIVEMQVTAALSKHKTWDDLPFLGTKKEERILFSGVDISDLVGSAVLKKKKLINQKDEGGDLIGSTTTMTAYTVVSKQNN